jgi:hypothetical protein
MTPAPPLRTSGALMTIDRAFDPVAELSRAPTTLAAGLPTHARQCSLRAAGDGRVDDVA